MAWLQAIIVLLNQTPLVRPLRRIYEFGFRRLIAALSRHPAVHCVFGCGSFFEGRPVYGLSDIDVIIVLRDGVRRSDAATGELAHAYERVRRLFPFLGYWHEKEANLIYLTDVRIGFPIPESFRVRVKQGKLVHVCGEPLPADLVAGPVTASEVLVELDTLLRIALVTDERHTRRLVFWKRIFSKLVALAALLDLAELTAQLRAHPELAFIHDSDTPLFFRTGQPERLFSLLLICARQLCAAIQTREPSVRTEFIPFRSGATQPVAGPTAAVKIWPHMERCGPFTSTTLPSIPIGIASALLYFSTDEPIPLIEFEGGAYRTIRALRQTLLRHGDADDNLLVAAEGVLFVVTPQPAFVDVVVLDPVLFANVYAAHRDKTLTVDLPASVLAEQQATVESTVHALAHLYRVHDGRVTKLSFPCIYREDDADVIENALRILRARIVTSEERLLVQDSGELLEYLRQRHPECQEFLDELQRYRHSLYNNDPAATVGNNLYHCLHQFMWQFLSGASSITVDAPYKHLGITVGVITRNRAADLAEMFESLTRQRRSPDEVLVVDNGSTDATPAVIEQFRARLPIRCVPLAEPSIPKARNLVIETAAHDIVSFIDDDCISEPEWLAAIERGFLRADNVGMVGGWVRHEPAPVRSSVDNYYRVFHHTKS